MTKSQKPTSTQQAIRNVREAIELVAWAAWHMLSPRAPADCPLYQAIPWRADAAVFDEISRAVLLVNPTDFDGLNRSDDAIGNSGEPGVVELHRQMASGALEWAGRLLAFELTTNPRQAEPTTADKLLVILSRLLRSERNLAPERVVRRGRFVLGPLGVWKDVAFNGAEFDRVEPADGTLGQYAQTIEQFEHASASLLRDQRFDPEPIGWGPGRREWLVERGIWEDDRRPDSKFFGMLGFRRSWSTHDRLELDAAFYARAAIAQMKQDEMLVQLGRCLARFGGECLQSAAWYAPVADQLENLGSLDQPSLHQLLLSVPAPFRQAIGLLENAGN